MLISVEWTAQQVEDWLLAFAYSTNGDRAVQRMAHRFGLLSLADDLRQVWVERTRTTIGRAETRAGATWGQSEDEVRAWCLTSLRHGAHDMLRRQTRTPEPIGDDQMHGVAESQWGADGTGHDRHDVSRISEVHDWCDEARTYLNARFVGGTITCGGQCKAAFALELALHVIAMVCDDEAHPTLARWAADITGGTSEWDRLMLQAIAFTTPEHEFLNAQGRVADAPKKRKQRCRPCVEDLLIAAAVDYRHSDGSPDAHPWKRERPE